jgi:hypothetical protein
MGTFLSEQEMASCEVENVEFCSHFSQQRAPQPTSSNAATQFEISTNLMDQKSVEK